LDRKAAGSRESDAVGNTLILAHVMSFFHIGSMGGDGLNIFRYILPLVYSLTPSEHR